MTRHLITDIDIPKQHLSVINSYIAAHQSNWECPHHEIINIDKNYYKISIDFDEDFGYTVSVMKEVVINV